MGNIKISESISIYFLVGLNLKIINCLFRNGIETMGQLVSAYPCEVSKFRGIGKKSLNDIASELAIYDVLPVLDEKGGEEK